MTELKAELNKTHHLVLIYPNGKKVVIPNEVFPYTDATLKDEHKYALRTKVGNIKNISPENAFKALRLNSAPETTIRTNVAEDRELAKVLKLNGQIRYKVLQNEHIIINITIADSHVFDPGIVVRTQIVDENGDIYHYTLGLGNGDGPSLNERIGKQLFKKPDTTRTIPLLKHFGKRPIPDNLNKAFLKNLYTSKQDPTNIADFEGPAIDTDKEPPETNQSRPEKKKFYPEDKIPKSLDDFPEPTLVPRDEGAQIQPLLQPAFMSQFYKGNEDVSLTAIREPDVSEVIENPVLNTNATTAEPSSIENWIESFRNKYNTSTETDDDAGLTIFLKISQTGEISLKEGEETSHTPRA